MSNLFVKLGLPNKIKIDCSEVDTRKGANGTKVYLNGKQLFGVQEINFTVSVDGLPCVTLQLLADVECLAPSFEKKEGAE